jgi:hypothetical protein
MKTRPILFSSTMIRALLEGRKTQTRRVIKAQIYGHKFNPPHPIEQCPYGQPGDLLWVRESFKKIASGHIRNGMGEARYGVGYRVDGETQWQHHVTRIWDLSGQPDRGPMQFKEQPWKPSIHMPRWASRLTLEITGVRVERLRDISEADAVSEATQPKNTGGDPRAWFASTWEKIHSLKSWLDNPWVWVIEFKVHKQNVDQFLKARAA